MTEFKPTVRIQEEDFDSAKEVGLLSEHHTNVGAVVTFTGICRDEKETVKFLELEHYSGMAETEVERMALEAAKRWPLIGLTAIHRFGRIEPGENIVFVASASIHRKAAFESAEFVMDFLKTRAPFWKKVHYVDGTESDWVEANSQDDEAAGRWI